VTSLPKKRPAETGGVVGALVFVIAGLFGVTDQDTLVAFGVIVGFVPAAITWTVATVRH
jgi:hypothetical protein